MCLASPLDFRLPTATLLRSSAGTCSLACELRSESKVNLHVAGCHTTTQLNTAQTGRNQHPIRQKIAPRCTAASRPSSIHHSVTTATASALSRFLVRNSLIFLSVLRAYRQYNYLFLIYFGPRLHFTVLRLRNINP
jgi:hypothetical protein